MTLKPPDRCLHLPRFQIDTNRINAKQKLPNMNKLEKLSDDGVISLEISEVASKEASAGSNPARSRKTIGMIYSITYADTPDEQHRMQLISDILFPGRKLTQNEKNDVEIVFNAKKYGYTLITSDGGSKSQPGGILGKRDELKKAVGVDIVTDEEAVNQVKQKIKSRDNYAREYVKRYEGQLPEWVGKD